MDINRNVLMKIAVLLHNVQFCISAKKPHENLPTREPRNRRVPQAPFINCVNLLFNAGIKKGSNLFVSRLSPCPFFHRGESIFLRVQNCLMFFVGVLSWNLGIPLDIFLLLRKLSFESLNVIDLIYYDDVIIVVTWRIKKKTQNL